MLDCSRRELAQHRPDASPFAEQSVSAQTDVLVASSSVSFVSEREGGTCPCSPAWQAMNLPAALPLQQQAPAGAALTWIVRHSQHHQIR